MMSALVVASYLPGEEHFTSRRFNVAAVECRSIFDYAATLAVAWSSSRVVVNVEHDVECTDELVAALVDCPHPLCAQTYPIVAAGNTVYPYCTPDRPDTWCQPGDEWAVWAAPGFIKTTPEARTGAIPADTHWESVEQAVNRAVTGLWHLHWPPVQHHHPY